MDDVVKLPANVAKKYDCTITQPIVITTGKNSQRIDLRKITVAQADALAASKSTVLVAKSKDKEESK